MIGVRIDPGKGIGVDDVYARREQRAGIEPGQHGVRGENPGHFGIEIDERDVYDLRILQDFADGEAIASAENQHSARSGNGRQARMDKRFMVTVFVAGAELQVAVEKKAQVVLEAREDKMLITSVTGKNNFVGIDIVLGGGGDALRFGKSHA